MKKLKRLQRQFSRKQKGGSNRKKLKMKIARLHARIANIRMDFLHKLTTWLARTFSVIGIENLNVKGMLKNHKLALAISDMGFYEFRRQLEYKCKEFGSHLEIVDRWFPSSKMCSSCGFRNDGLTLKDRDWVCPECGIRHDRDINAAINIRNFAAEGFKGNLRQKVLLAVSSTVPSGAAGFARSLLPKAALAASDGKAWGEESAGHGSQFHGETGLCEAGT